jgi:thiol-disulfide isomerase/thioredoxin
LPLCAVLVACASAPEGPDRDRRIGRSMELVAPRLDGEGELRLSDLRGRVVLVDIWASWCVPCRDAMHAWEGLRETLGADFEVVAVSVDEAPEDARDFLAELAPSYPSVWDGKRTLVRAFPIAIMPTTYLLDRDGVVRFAFDGFHDEMPAEVERLARDLMAGPPDEPEGGGPAR